MKYQYHDLSSKQFEQLVSVICSILFGMGFQEFTDGADGGRDGRFNGVANDYPSKSSPWDGITIIQAKHTMSINAKTSDNSFFGNKSSIINTEVAKVKKLYETAELDNYLLFTNRKNTANTNEKIINYIHKETGIPLSCIGLIGLEDIERLIKFNPSIVNTADLNPFAGPLIVDPDSLAKVIELIADSKEKLSELSSEILTIERTSFKEKNTINGLSKEYSSLIEGYVKSFNEIAGFLEHPDNDECLEFYEESCEELKSSIIAHSKDLGNFDKVLDYIIRMLVDRDSTLKSHKRLTRAMVYFMYFNCDIGKNK